MKASNCRTLLVVFLTHELKKVMAIINNRCNPEDHGGKSSFGGGSSYLFMTLCGCSNLWFQESCENIVQVHSQVGRLLGQRLPRAHLKFISWAPSLTPLPSGVAMRLNCSQWHVHSRTVCHFPPWPESE